MVNYAEEADFLRGKRRKKRLSPQEAQERRRARNEARTEEEWHSLARDIVYRQLGMADRSEKQLRDALARRDVPAEVIDTTIARFLEADLINDSKYAQSFVRLRFAEKSTSRRKLREELRNRGITGDLAEQALTQVSDSDEYHSAVQFVRKKMRANARLDQEVARRRIYGALARRGFSPDVIGKAMDSVNHTDEDGASW
ncbi:regulatory protein [Arcanobacterium pluranimalium]|uniref:regulatory protein RecX n=1 Tax=Arcanobacterium pluranimalium TaxID=108028 RepID=UPI00195C564F|nr:regulatory protein RecX [Arcanobacterium pluranimalium]MBM7825620.1 regulatory protein [Arcanobacterium pluranimalium]